MDVLGITETTVRHLQEKILLGELPGGLRLNETALAEQLEISRPPLREAFRMLENQHLVKSIPRKGTFVTALSIHDFEQIYDSRIMMEDYAIQILQNRKIKKPKGLRESFIASLASKVKVATSSDALLNGWRSLSAFHINLVETTENQYIIHGYNTIKLNLGRYQILYGQMTGCWEECWDRHEEILENIEKGYYDKARYVLKKHINDVFEAVRTIIEEITRLQQPGL